MNAQLIKSRTATVLGLNSERYLFSRCWSQRRKGQHRPHELGSVTEVNIDVNRNKMGPSMNPRGTQDFLC